MKTHSWSRQKSQAKYAVLTHVWNQSWSERDHRNHERHHKLLELGWGSRAWLQAPRCAVAPRLGAPGRRPQNNVKYMNFESQRKTAMQESNCKTQELGGDYWYDATARRKGSFATDRNHKLNTPFWNTSETKGAAKRDRRNHERHHKMLELG